MQSFEKIKELISSVEADVIKFSQKGNQSAGTRVRVAMQDLKKLAQEVRLEVKQIREGSED